MWVCRQRGLDGDLSGDFMDLVPGTGVCALLQCKLNLPLRLGAPRCARAIAASVLAVGKTCDAKQGAVSKPDALRHELPGFVPALRWLAPCAANCGWRGGRADALRLAPWQFHQKLEHRGAGPCAYTRRPRGDLKKT